MDPREVLAQAADYIAVHGHCKGTLFSYEDKPDTAAPAACAMGALRAVSGLHYPAAANLLGRHLMDAGEIPPMPADVLPGQMVPGWNDAPERTAEDVILAMKRVAGA